MIAFLRRMRPALLGLAGAVVLAGCANRGFSGRDAELNRLQGRAGVALLELRPDQALFLARGREVAVAPMTGLCLDRQSVEIRGGNAFMLLADCPLQISSATLANGSDEVLEIGLPPSFPGLVTVSIGARPLVEEGEAPADAMDRLGAFLMTAAGRASLARGSGAEVAVVETRVLDDTLYVLVQEETAEVAFLAPRYWRSFGELNGRAVVVTVSAVAETTVGSDEMLARLARQTAELRAANGHRAVDEELRLAAAVPQSDRARKAVVRRTVRRSAGAEGPPSSAPVPLQNPRIVQVKAVLDADPTPARRPDARAAPVRSEVAPTTALRPPRAPR